MKIKCPDCNTSYDIKASALGAKGRSVKCAKCGNSWFASPDSDETVGAIAPEQKAEAADKAAWMDDQQDEETAEFDGSESELEDDADADMAAFSADDEVQDPVKRAPPPAEPKKPAAPANTAPELDADGKPIDIETMANRPKIKVNPNKFRRDHIGAVIRWIMRRNFHRIGGISLFVAAIALCGFLLTIRASIVKQAPDLASLFEIIGMEVNLRGLEFRDLRTFSEQEEGQQVLVVEGSIRNLETQENDVPAVRLSIRGTDLQEIYAWTVEPRTRVLKALDETRFRTILADPPTGASDIQVRFVDRGLRQNALE
ncbi:putative Zn finger-like uncharacterized protein [Roseibium hamelinense]|uniref:Putative Zn finger-like uncharacterized protein n=1 Tax=Roseibium hamelinense TaxID=150831 RepID=A0A562SND7_9HYPH|nr:zinc-ribbon domain-containing protein [Roseibium hamelinense]MTI44040.1 thioredoxin [Roseibium hamelinense]TWI82752.1 putative Zn finger-like uncharacterized protein [Roseibium hamelinense]